MKSANKSGTSTATFEKVQKEFKGYNFFAWIDQFLKARTTKTNVSMVNMEFTDEEKDLDTQEDYDLGPSVSDIESGKEITLDGVENSSANKQKNTQKRKRSSKDDAELSIIEDIRDNMKRRQESKEKRANSNLSEQDSESLFCQTVAAELRQFNAREICMIKHDIREILYKYKMSRHANLGSSSNVNSIYPTYFPFSTHSAGEQGNMFGFVPPQNSTNNMGTFGSPTSSTIGSDVNQR